MFKLTVPLLSPLWGKPKHKQNPGAGTARRRERERKHRLIWKDTPVRPPRSVRPAKRRALRALRKRLKHQKV